MEFGQMKRRDFITVLGGATAWPLVTRAQQSDPMRRIGVHLGFKEGDPEAQPLVVAFQQGLQEFGWADGRNIRLDYRWATSDPERVRTQATELVQSAPDAIVVN